MFIADYNGLREVRAHRYGVRERAGTLCRGEAGLAC